MLVLTSRGQYTQRPAQQPLRCGVTPRPRECLAAFRRPLEHARRARGRRARIGMDLIPDGHDVRLRGFVNGHGQRAPRRRLAGAEPGQELARAPPGFARSLEELGRRRPVFDIHEDHLHHCDGSHSFDVHGGPLWLDSSKRQQDVAPRARGAEAGQHVGRCVLLIRLLACDEAHVPVNQR